MEGVFASDRNRTLHGLVVTGGMAPSRALVQSMGVADPDASTAALAADGLVDPKPHALLVTGSGRVAHGELLGKWREEADLSRLRHAYDSFAGSLNTEFKRLVTEWQTDRAAGGHELMWEVSRRLEGVHERVSPLLRRAEGTDARFGCYRPLLRDALQRVHAGEHEYLSGMQVASYHNVWWWLHEDLLRSLDLKEENR